MSRAGSYRPAVQAVESFGAIVAPPSDPTYAEMKATATCSKARMRAVHESLVIPGVPGGPGNGTVRIEA